jgi:hypothetical protein
MVDYRYRGFNKFIEIYRDGNKKVKKITGQQTGQF